jgi:D-serine deaminase-like pyridoxal phosphate-dependent protein
MQCSRAMPCVADLATPALCVDADAFAYNLDTMARALPGGRLRPHVKAHKSTAIAREQRARGHTGFTCATPREVVGMARAGFDDLLLANESVDPARLRAVAGCNARVMVAVDSDETLDASVANGITDVLVDVNVGLRCGCHPDDAGRLADRARDRGLVVHGVMGYEGHVQLVPDRAARVEGTEKAMTRLAPAIAAVGGDVISGGGTGTYDINTTVTEIQAGSYALMDTHYDALSLPFRPALRLVATVIHVDPKYVVADCGLKALGMDHGLPTVEGAGDTIACSDEHVLFVPGNGARVGERVLVRPAHVDPTVAYHERMHVASGAGLDADVIDAWLVDLRGWDV